MTTNRAFRTFGGVTLAAVFFLILVGAIVRASGAGMGCPDWPKCFGQWIPPTDVSQLPENYQEIYAHRGYADTEFNAFKTWTEYINRLIGAAIGILVFITMLLSLRYWRADKPVVALSAGAFVLTGFAGWLGKTVVESNLHTGLITLHMATALLIVTCLVWALTRANRENHPGIDNAAAKRIQAIALACLVLTVVQVLMGTQVRQNVDIIADNLGENARSIWAGELGILFYVHRTFSITVLIANAALLHQVFRHARHSAGLRRTGFAALVCIAAEIAGGAGMYYLGFPRVLQPLHLLFGALLFGAQIYLVLAAGYARRQREESGDFRGIAATAHR